MSLPPLPERLAAQRDQMEQVHECQTPVLLFTELADGKVRFYLDIPLESPTVRGYASILVEGFQDATPAEVLKHPGRCLCPAGPARSHHPATGPRPACAAGLYEKTGQQGSDPGHLSP